MAQSFRTFPLHNRFAAISKFFRYAWVVSNVALAQILTLALPT
jgi:hypothetical protein